MRQVLKQWISNGDTHPFYARKGIHLAKAPKAASIAICGLGQFQLYINGRRVSDRVLDPAWTDYDKLVNYVVFDITDYLNSGKNVIAAEIGNGWYIMDTEEGYSFNFPEFMPPNPNPYHLYGKALVLAAHIEIMSADDSTEVYDADETWKVAKHPVQISNCYGSERVDGRQRIPEWNEVSLDDSKWDYAVLTEGPKGKLVEQTIPPIKVIQEYEGRFLYEKEGKNVYDFGQNASGLLEFSVKGKAGDVIRIYPAEKLGSDGLADQMAKNWMMIDVCDTYIIGKDDEWETFAITFSYVCCRYVMITGCGASQIKDMRLRAITSATKKAGTFSCDDKRYMQIYDLIEKTVEANMLSVHTDCPTIERFAWQEENHLMAPSVMYMKQVKAHWEKFLTDTRTAQHTAEDYFYDFEGGKYYPGDGLIPAQAPCYIPNVLPVPGMGSFYDIIGWGSTIILGTWWHYLFYGDDQIIRDNYEAGKRYLTHLKTRVTEDGFINHGLGDWGNPTGEFARSNVETAFLFADAKLLAHFANIIGKDAEAEEFLQYAKQVKDLYNEKLLVYDEANDRYCYRVWEHREAIVMTQAAEAVPLFWGMVPEEAETDVVAALKDLVQSSGALQSGEVGQPYIIQTMARYGMNDLLSEVILKEEHPSYYAFVKAGETTLGEYWEENPRSHCHDMMGHIAEWYYNGIAGIKPVEPGFKKVLIQPYLPKSMNEMTCMFDSISGRIAVVMKREEGKINLTVDVSEGITYTIDRTYLA